MPANGTTDSPEMAPNGQPIGVADPYAPTTWGRRYEDLTCPSGQTCKIRKLGVEQLIAEGAIEDLDTLTAFVNKKHIEPKAKSVKKGAKGKSGNPAVAAKQQKDATQQAMGVLEGVSSDDVRRMFGLMDIVVMAAVVAPKLHPVPEPEGPDGEAPERVEGIVYIDDVDAVDKSYIFNYVFAGVKDLESFRKQLSENAAALGDVQDLDLPTQRDSLHKE